eukprot:scaffold72791_cov72-Phaeocystis_antarctica.AAC.2
MKLTRSLRPAATCPMAKLACSRRPAAEDVLIVATVAGRKGEVAAPWTSTLGSASAPITRSRRHNCFELCFATNSRCQPAQPRSSRVGSTAMAMATAKAIAVRRLSSRWLFASVASSAFKSSGKARELKVNATVVALPALQITPLSGPGVEIRAVLLVAGVVVRLALTPVGKAGSVSRNAAAPTLGGAEPRLVLVHAAEERGGALGRHEVAARAPRGATGRGSPAGWADSRRGGWEEEDGGDRHQRFISL